MEPWRILRDLAGGFVVLVATSLLTLRVAGWMPGGGQVVGLALGLYVAQGVVLWTQAPARLPEPGIGWPNRITLLRSSMVLPLAALLPLWGTLDTAALWWVVVVASAAMALDGVDGRVARRTRSETAYGARFDMELDAFLILVLSAGVWLGGRAGAWILLVGLLRYLFVAAGWIWPRLTAPLPESRRRKTVCVVQGVALLVALAPVTPGWFALVAGVVALGSLLYSFGVDTLWLLRDPGTRGPQGSGPVAPGPTR